MWHTAQELCVGSGVLCVTGSQGKVPKCQVWRKGWELWLWGPVHDLGGVGLHPHLTRVWFAPRAVAYDKVTDNKCIMAQLPVYTKPPPDPHLILRATVCGSI